MYMMYARLDRYILHWPHLQIERNGDATKKHRRRQTSAGFRGSSKIKLGVDKGCVTVQTSEDIDYNLGQHRTIFQAEIYIL